ncbi:MAG: carbohydrate kinase, partial [Enterobacterales bacterium]|nr:carbohydrate kinase [Enterobacterales bacterium]
HRREHLLQAVYEGVVFSHMTHLNRMRERFTQVRKLRVTGGPARSKVWMQMLADVSGLPVELPQVEETGCLGAALVALVGSGVYSSVKQAQSQLNHAIQRIEPDSAAWSAYQLKFTRYQYLIEALHGYHVRCSSLSKS